VNEDTLRTILEWSDAGHKVATIAAQVSLKERVVYAALARHRPDRPREARRLTSVVPAKIAALQAAGATPTRIAELCGVSRAYVYRHLARPTMCCKKATRTAKHLC
jgi:hypothetical protein